MSDPARSSPISERSRAERDSLSLVVAADAQPPSSRTVGDALALLAQVEGEALDTLARHDLPSEPGLYRRAVAGDEWTLMPQNLSVEERWAQILQSPPDDGFRYLSLADVARAEHPTIAAVQVAAATLDRIDELKRLLQDGVYDESGSSLLMFWSTMELMAVLFGNRKREDSRRGRRAVEWEIWRSEARRVWSETPDLSDRVVAQYVVARLDLIESYHTVRRRLAGCRPEADPTPADPSTAASPLV